MESASQPLLADLNHQKLVSVIGPDAGTFLQGQVTCDIRELSHNISLLGAHCTPKGRMIASFRCAQLASDHIALRIHTGIAEPTAQSLGKYIVFSKAKLHHESQTFRLLGLAGKGAEQALAGHFGAAPQRLNEVLHCDDRHLIKVGEQRFECWLPTAAADSALAALAPACTVIGTAGWDLLEIRAGLGQVRPGSVELFIPQMLNFQLVGGINFKKGCYTGQEVVARMHYLGKLKRHMYRAAIATDDNRELPAAGADLFGDNTEQSIGHVVMAAPAGDNSVELLIVATAEAAAANRVFLDKERLQKLDLLSLPYAITNNQEP